MANTIRIKRSTGSTAISSCANAELSLTEGNEVLYYGKGTGGAGGSATTIIPIGGKGKFWDKETSYSANFVLAAPSNGAGASVMRILADADIPSIPHTRISDFDAGVRTNRLNELTVPNAAVDFNSQKITGLATPTANTDGVNKAYVDSVAQALDVKDSVVVATTGNGAISTAYANGQTVDGVTLTTGDRILLKDQTSGAANGIYNVNASGSPSRASDMATGANAAGNFVFVEKGTINGNNGFVCTTDTAVVGTNALVFTQFSGAGQVITGDGIQKSGNTISLDLKANSGVIISSTELAIDLSASSIAGTLSIGDGGTGATSSTAALTNLGFSNYGKTLIDDADAAAARTTLGLGSIATQAANSVAITGGSIINLTTFDGITVDGGSF
nr:phage-related tail fiber protein [uncultured Mediterranean phage uvMED]